MGAEINHPELLGFFGRNVGSLSGVKSYPLAPCRAMVKSRVFSGMGDLPPLTLQWVYKPLRTWVDEFFPYYMEIMGVKTMAHVWNIDLR